MFRLSTSIHDCQPLLLAAIVGIATSGCIPSPEEHQQPARSVQKTLPSKQAPTELEAPQKIPVTNPVANIALAAPLRHEPEKLETSPRPETQPVKFETAIVAAFERLVKPTDSVADWEKANQALLEFGQDAIPLLASKLKSGDDIERETAASTIVSFGADAQAAVPELRLALQDTLPFVQVNAAVALLQFADENEKAIPTLVALLEHSDESVRQMASMNLSTLGEEASKHVADLTRLLEKPDGSDVLLPVVELLGRIGPAAEDAVPKLKQIAFEQKGEIGDAANSAIELIQTQPE